VSWTDLAGLRLCLLIGSMQNRRIIDRHLADAGVSVQAAVESNSLLALVAQVLSGDWATVVTEQAARMFGNRPDLVALRIDPLPGTEPRPAPQVGLIAAWRETHTPVLAALIEAAERLTGRRSAPPEPASGQR
jgi:DNA-binding transcriptional LysR family regulator